MLLRYLRPSLALCLAALVGSSACKGGGGGDGGSGGGQHPTPVTSHPRLFLNEKNLDTIRARSTTANPLYSQSVVKVASFFKAAMDAGTLPGNDNDCKDTASGIICEMAMETLAFMAVVSPDQKERDDYAAHAKKLLMNMIGKAKQGPLAGDPIRDPTFPTSNRSHDGGEAFGLTVDWIYPYLSDDEKQDIRTVFLAWAEALINAHTTNADHPEPVGVFNDPVLLQDKFRLRYAGNNFFATHSLNLGLMAMALDEDDDAGGKLHAYLDNVTGAFLYMTDALMRGDLEGGKGAEGSEYDPLTLGSFGMLMLALHTAGLDDADKRGKQVVMAENPFWKEAPDAFLHGLAPTPSPTDYFGSYYTYCSYGDAEVFTPFGPPQGDPIRMNASIGIIAKDRGDTALYDRIRWIQTYAAPGGEQYMIQRADSPYSTLWTILYFLLFDPKADAPADPRSSLPLDYWSEGLRLGLSRTGWGQNDSYFTYQLIWPDLDHRHSDDNHFGLFRKGEWITMETAGYADQFFTAPMHNNVAVQNDAPSTQDSFFQMFYQSGSAYVYGADGDGQVLAHSANGEYFYALGDSTDQHNWAHIGSAGVTHLSRSIVWIKPDHVITYDRVATKNPGWKRVHVQLPAPPAVSGNAAHTGTKGGQRIFVTSLLPAGALLTGSGPTDHTANGQPMFGRLQIEAPANPTTARFLGVLQGADGGASADPATLVQSTAGTPFEGAAVHGVAVLFPVDLGPVGSVTFTAPSGTARFLVTGLTPGGKYSAQVTTTSTGVTVTVTSGSDKTADEGGVLAF
jgi:hypothetical protein